MLKVEQRARGFDLWAAQEVLGQQRKNPQIRLSCVVPYEGFEKKWAKEAQAAYREVLQKADDTKVFYPAFTYAAFQARNCYMVDHAALVIAGYNGARGGTRNTLDDAKIQCVPVWRVKV